MPIPEVQAPPLPGGVPVTPPRDRSRTLRIIGILTLVLLAALVIFVSHGVLLIIAALLLGTVLRDLATSIEKRTPLSQGWSLVVLLLAALVFLVGFGFIAAPEVATQADQLSEALPGAVDKATSWLKQYGWGRRALDQARDAIQGGGGDMLRRAERYFTTTFSALADIFIILVLGIFFAASTSTYRKGFLRLFPPGQRPRVTEILDAVGETVGAWMRGQLVSMAYLGTVTYIGLMIIGVPLALILAVIVGLLTIIPFIGPLLSIVPIGLISLVDSPTTALWAVGYFIVMQNTEGNLVTPLIQQHAVDLPPLILLSAQIILGSLFGFYGILLAAPVTAIAMVLVKMLYLEDVLGQDTKHPGSS